MSARVPADVQASIQARVESGQYRDAGEVIREALAALDERERQEQDRLRDLLAVGVDEMERGEVAEYTPELRAEIRASARRRLRAGEHPSPDVCP